MALVHLNSRKFQIGDTRNLAHLNTSTITSLTTDASLEGRLRIFLLTCQVNNLSPRSIADYSQKISAFVRFCQREGIAEPKEVNANHVRFFLLAVQQRCKPVSVHDYYGTIKRFFNWLVEEEIIEQNPMVRMHPPKVPKELINPLKSQDIGALLTLCGNGFLGARNRAIILTFLDTGLRLSELASIQLQDMDLDRETIKVMGKGAKERLVRIGKETQKAILKYLLQRRDDLPCLWVTEERRPMQSGGIQIMIRRLGKRAGLRNVRCSPHTFRHTFAINCLRNGMGEFSLQWILGHSTLQMTRKYVGSLGATDAIKAHRLASPVDNMKF